MQTSEGLASMSDVHRCYLRLDGSFGWVMGTGPGSQEPFHTSDTQLTDFPFFFVLEKFL